MNGADVLGDALLANGVDFCFANPGTSEMHFVAALDRRPGIRCVLGLFEGVVTAAADGYARMAEKPAATLLHCGPGLANGLANLHNARRAHTPMVNIVGDHATHHLIHDAPLTTDIDALARPVSQWLGRVGRGDDIAALTAEACRQAWAGPGIATLVLPADMAWGEVTATPNLRPCPPPVRALPDEATLDAAVMALRHGGRTGLMLGAGALRGPALEAAGRIAARTGVRLFAEMFNGRIERGRGRVRVTKIPYPVDAAIDLLSGIDSLVLVGAAVPVAFFAYPGKPSRLVRNDCRIVHAGGPAADLAGALQAMADALGAGPRATRDAASAETPSLAGPMSGEAVCGIVAALLPDNAVLCDESLTAGFRFFADSQGSAPHDYLQLTGGAIGIGIPLAAGAALGSPGRKVVTLQADGSAMYTVQGLWTQARERLDVVTVILSNRGYAILHGEMARVGVDAIGRNARAMLDLDDPALDWVSLARGLGVEAERATTLERFAAVLTSALARPGPFLIEAVL